MSVDNLLTCHRSWRRQSREQCQWCRHDVETNPVDVWMTCNETATWTLEMKTHHAVVLTPMPASTESHPLCQNTASFHHNVSSADISPHSPSHCSDSPSQWQCTMKYCSSQLFLHFSSQTVSYCFVTSISCHIYLHQGRYVLPSIYLPVC